MTAEERQTWTCVDCAVVVSFSSQGAAPAPPSWRDGPRGWLCLNCQREEVAAAAPSAPDAESRTERRRALTEFELLRDPEATDGQIARRAKTSPAVVRPIRAELHAAGRLPSG